MDVDEARGEDEAAGVDDLFTAARFEYADFGDAVAGDADAEFFSGASLPSETRALMMMKVAGGSCAEVGIELSAAASASGAANSQESTCGLDWDEEYDKNPGGEGTMNRVGSIV